MKKTLMRGISILLMAVMAITSVAGATVPAKAATISFTDVKQGSWYYNEVMWAAENGIVNGVGNNKFDPNGTCTTEMILTMLYRYAGSPTPQSNWNTRDYTDVKSNAWYYNALHWADATGVRPADTSTKYGVGTVCKREDVCLYLWRLVGSPSVTYKNVFTDVSVNNTQAKAIQWAVDNGICQGIGNNKFGYSQSCTRCQIATFLYRFYSYSNKANPSLVQPKTKTEESTTIPDDGYTWIPKGFKQYNTTEDFTAAGTRWQAVYLRYKDGVYQDTVFEDRTSPGVVASRSNGKTVYNLLGFDLHYHQTQAIDTSKPITKASLEAFLKGLGFEFFDPSTPVNYNTQANESWYLRNSILSQGKEAVYDEIIADLTNCVYATISDSGRRDPIPAEGYTIYVAVIENSDGTFRIRVRPTWG